MPARCLGTPSQHRLQRPQLAPTNLDVVSAWGAGGRRYSVGLRRGSVQVAAPLRGPEGLEGSTWSDGFRSEDHVEPALGWPPPLRRSAPTRPAPVVHRALGRTRPRGAARPRRAHGCGARARGALGVSLVGKPRAQPNALGRARSAGLEALRQRIKSETMPANRPLQTDGHCSAFGRPCPPLNAGVRRSSGKKTGREPVPDALGSALAPRRPRARWIAKSADRQGMPGADAVGALSSSVLRAAPAWLGASRCSAPGAW